MALPVTPLINLPKNGALRALSELVAQCASIETRISCLEAMAEHRKLEICDHEEESFIQIVEVEETSEVVIASTG